MRDFATTLAERNPQDPCPTCEQVGGYCGGENHPSCGFFENGRPVAAEVRDSNLLGNTMYNDSYLYGILDGPLFQVLAELKKCSVGNQPEIAELASQWLAEIEEMTERQFTDWKEREDD